MWWELYQTGSKNKYLYKPHTHTQTYTQVPVFQFVSLFGQIRGEKLQNPLFKIIWLHRLYKIDRYLHETDRNRKKVEIDR